MPRNTTRKKHPRINFTDKLTIIAASTLIAGIFHDGTQLTPIYSTIPFTATMIAGIIITEKEKNEQSSKQEKKKKHQAIQSNKL